MLRTAQAWTTWARPTGQRVRLQTPSLRELGKQPSRPRSCAAPGPRSLPTWGPRGSPPSALLSESPPLPSAHRPAPRPQAPPRAGLLGKAGPGHQHPCLPSSSPQGNVPAPPSPDWGRSAPCSALPRSLAPRQALGSVLLLAAVQSLSYVQTFAPPLMAARQDSLFTNSQEFAQTHVHWASDAHPTSRPLSSPFLLPSVFPSISIRIRWPKYWSFSFNISPSNEHSVLVSFRMDWLDLPAVQGTLC